MFLFFDENIEIMVTNPEYSTWIDFTASVTLFGHSLGAQASVYNANIGIVENFNIGALFMQSNTFTQHPTTNMAPSVPTFFATGKYILFVLCLYLSGGEERRARSEERGFLVRCQIFRLQNYSRQNFSRQI